MSYPHLSTETLSGCTQAAYDYDPDCYCVFHWNYADFPPKMQYLGLWTKWLQVNVWRTTLATENDRLVLSCQSETGPNLLRQLRTALTELTANPQADPSRVASAEAQQQLSATLRHPLLGTGLLLHTLDKLLPDLPAHQVFDLTKRLQRVIHNRQQQVYQPPAGSGWIASAPQTTQPLPSSPPY